MPSSDTETIQISDTSSKDFFSTVSSTGLLPERVTVSDDFSLSDFVSSVVCFVSSVSCFVSSVVGLVVPVICFEASVSCFGCSVCFTVSSAAFSSASVMSLPETVATSSVVLPPLYRKTSISFSPSLSASL